MIYQCNKGDVYFALRRSKQAKQFLPRSIWFKRTNFGWDHGVITGSGKFLNDRSQSCLFLCPLSKDLPIENN